VGGGEVSLQVGDCLSRGWGLLSANFGLLFGATFVVWLISLACQFTPIIGMVSWLLDGVLYGGLYVVFLGRIRGEPVTVADAFRGFGVAFVQLMLVGLVTKVLTTIGLICCLVLPGLYLLVAWIFCIPLVIDRRLEFWSAMELSRKVVTRVWFQMLGLLVVAFLPVIIADVFVQAKITAALMPLLNEVMGAGSGLLNMAHLKEEVTQVAVRSLPLVLFVKVVLLLNLPFATGALMYAYEDLFGSRNAPKA
jgi:hypothetical protein